MLTLLPAPELRSPSSKAICGKLLHDYEEGLESQASPSPPLGSGPSLDIVWGF